MTGGATTPEPELVEGYQLRAGTPRCGDGVAAPAHVELYQNWARDPTSWGWQFCAGASPISVRRCCSPSWSRQSDLCTRRDASAWRRCF